MTMHRRATGRLRTGVLFRMSVGRRNNADPRWLLPIICRLGHVTKREVGAIRIFEQETKFEVAEHAAARFAAAVRRSSSDEDIRIKPVVGPRRPAPGGDHETGARGRVSPTKRPEARGGKPSRRSA